MFSKNIFMIGMMFLLVATPLISNVSALNDSQLLQICYADETGQLMILCSGTDEELGPPIGTYPAEEEVPGGGGGGRLKPPVHQLFEKVVGKEISVSTYRIILWSLIGIVFGVLIWLFFIRKRKRKKEEKEEE